MPRIEVPGVGAVDFPDTMQPDEISTAAQRLFQEHQQATAPSLDLGSKTPEQAAVLAAQARPGGQPMRVGQAGMADAIRAEMDERGMSHRDRMLLGASKSLVDTGYAVKQMLPGLDKEDEANVQSWRDLQEGGGPAATVGNVVGHAAQMAIPGTQITKSARLAQALRAHPVTSGAAVGAAVGAGEAALQPTLGDESRAENMAVGATAGAAGGTLFPLAGAVARRAGRPVGLSKTMQAEVDAGYRPSTGEYEVVPTVGQAIDTAGSKYNPKVLAKKAYKAAENTLRAGTSFGQKRSRNEAIVRALNDQIEELGGVPLIPYRGTDYKATLRALDKLNPHPDSSQGVVRALLREANGSGKKVDFDSLKNMQALREDTILKHLMDVIDVMFPAPADKTSLGDIAKAAVGGGAAYVSPTMGAPAVGAVLAGSTRPGARVALGLTKTQEAMRRAKLYPDTKTSVLPGAAAAAMITNQED